MAKNPSTLLLSLADQSSAMLGRASLTAGYAGATRRPGAALTRGSLGRKVAWRVSSGPTEPAMKIRAVVGNAAPCCYNHLQTIQVDIPRASDTESTADISKPTASQAARRQDEHLPCVDGEQVVKRYGWFAARLDTCRLLGTAHRCNPFCTSIVVGSLKH
jgi:hypothetical protein